MKNIIPQNTPKSFNERRSNERFISDSLTLTHIDSTAVNSSIVNINRTGLCIKNSPNKDIGKRLYLILQTYSNNIRLTGRLIWVDKNNNCGIDLSEYKDQVPAFWDGYIEGLQSISSRRRHNRRLEKGIIKTNKRKGERRNTKPILKKCFTNTTSKFLQNQGNWFKEYATSGSPIVILGGKKTLSFSYCNYLGLNHSEKVKKAMIDSIIKDGAGISSSPVTGGTMLIHKKLERSISAFMCCEDALLYPLGSLANYGVIPAISGVNDYIILDENSHASIVDACILSKSHIVTYRHNDMDDLNRKLKKYSDNNKLIVSDGVFSMDGDFAKLDKIYELGVHYNTAIYIDDAHGVGVFGKTGGGIVEYYGLEGKIDFVMATFAKAFGIQGGFVVAKKEIIQYLRYTSRTSIFNVSLQPYMISGILESLELIRNGTDLRKKLWENIHLLKEELNTIGFDTLQSNSPIIPVMIRNSKKTQELCEYLRNNNIVTDAIFYPVVKKANSMLRVVLSAEHSQENIKDLVCFLEKGKKILQII
ncbi:MAG: aminotransferase class I/II-fold pyridoxal phosphate-dependent enzyme [bacterium]|nr:aminotransferase class I/II-fold pyridoxal phosphate-dependent enzyme [bacterium]